MKRIHNLLKEGHAKSMASFMKLVCYFIIFLLASGLTLSLMGRQTFILHTSTGTYNSAIYSEQSHDWTSRGPTASINDEIRVITNQDIDFITQVGLSTMYAVNIIPLIICFWFLGRVFSNISKGLIFTEQNAKYLLYYGLIQIATALLAPFLKLLISHIANLFTSSEISIATGQNMINDLIPNIAFIVAAYIIHYGIHLQDEVDHTL